MSDVRNVLRLDGTAPSERATCIEQLYEAEGPRLLRFFQRRTGDAHSAADLVQDAFIRLAGSRRFGDLANPAAYLQRIARNLLVDRARWRATHEALHVPLAEWDGQGAAVQEETLVARDMLRLYEQAMAELPERTRTIFLFQRLDGMTYREIANELGVTLWTVEHHMKRAIAHIDRVFEDA
ncbi:RNA polymerase sigma factor [Hephaestia sp. GCM10023244]|uniref:RNA polymerase sigma factor n=1 Tax=unclassified Hephaestia TaxID=2631281 RepID=UPI002076F8C0|nr:sigma-70 family RNA polymerase sigma factor [Hephaestia sp. MAHUQ-44]MCM8732394.1 sigma-70 family RNA polymerase sigma factor [Hephaestia sp. MAHUQ-44]